MKKITFPVIWTKNIKNCVYCLWPIFKIIEEFLIVIVLKRHKIVTCDLSNTIHSSMKFFLILMSSLVNVNKIIQQWKKWTCKKSLDHEITIIVQNHSCINFWWVILSMWTKSVKHKKHVKITQPWNYYKCIKTILFWTKWGLNSFNHELIALITT